MKKILVTGADGMLGVDLVDRLNLGPWMVEVSTISQMDITKPDSVRKNILKIHPDIIIHTAAYTAVDRAETERDLCMAVNFHGTENIASLCRKIDAELIYFSTDYVFDGKKESPYIETDITAPLNVYGESKLLGEKAIRKLVKKHKIFRISWLLGLHGITGTNFIEAILRAAQKKKTLRVISDQKGRATFTFDLAEIVEKFLFIPEWGTFHITNSGDCTWFDLAKAVLMQNDQADVEIIPIPTSEYKCDAQRPLNSRMDSIRLPELEIPIRGWQEALAEYMRRRKND
jgi:dTDP-4-dehydrorhamnose reductase